MTQCLIIVKVNVLWHPALHNFIFCAKDKNCSHDWHSSLPNIWLFFLLAWQIVWNKTVTVCVVLPAQDYSWLWLQGTECLSLPEVAHAQWVRLVTGTERGGGSAEMRKPACVQAMQKTNRQILIRLTLQRKISADADVGPRLRVCTLLTAMDIIRRMCLQSHMSNVSNVLSPLISIIYTITNTIANKIGWMIYLSDYSVWIHIWLCSSVNIVKNL